MTDTEALKVKAAFIIVMKDDNTYQVVPYEDAKLEVERPATRVDVRIGCSEILGTVTRQDTINELLTVMFSQQPQEVAPDSQE